jgi:hypothetical protein
MTGATATRHGHAISAEKLPGNFQRLKTAAAFARGSFLCRNGWFRFHYSILNREVFGRDYFAKPSAISIALRIAMDLLIVSWNSASGVESLTQPPPACT